MTAEACGESTGPSTVLVVDDEPGIRALLRAVLEAIGIKVLVAEDGQQALQIVSSEASIDLLITDVIMPNLDGGQLALKVQRSHPHIKILFMSADTNGLLEAKSGCTVFQKPLSVQTLVRVVSDLLQLSPPN
jgi:two-component system, cell cycle sensor histidine kinase and response regulator CckA